MDILINCRLCNSKSIANIISMGEQKNTSMFPKYGDMSLKKFPLDICLCDNCGLVQMKQTTNPDELYKQDYGYRSSISNTMRNHLKSYNKELLEKIELNNNDVVLDIGSNDGTTLKFYSDKIRRIGIDPTGDKFKKYYDNNIELLPDYFTKNNFLNAFGDIKCKIVTSIAMFYDLPNPLQFAKDIYDILDDEGIWTCEQSYLLSMLKTNSLDTICHEHLEYYALTQIKYIADNANFKIIDIKFNDCNGGSFRIYFAKNKSVKYTECSHLINHILTEEREYNIENPEIYKKFMNSCDIELKKLTDFIDIVNDNKEDIYIYGASTKGNCILQYCNIDETKVKYAVERNMDKIGKSTSTGIEIISEETMRANPPKYLIVLPWHFKKEIIEREKTYLDNGGQLIFYFPTFEIVSNKQKTLITGCDGFIASYVKEQFTEHILYGITKSKKNVEKNITKAFLDMNNYSRLENIITIVNPDNIIHLAGTSSSIDSFKNPLESLHNNGMLTAYLCDIIYKNNINTKLFNAASSEIYKGYINHKIDEYDGIDQKNINAPKHIHPYSIAKNIGLHIVEFYRTTYNLHFSNGIIFTTESKRKSDKFLLNKISNHIKRWKSGNLEALTIGNLESYRNIIHPHDVANSIKYILENNEGDDYLICNYNSHKMYDLVEQLFKISNINIVRGEIPSAYYDENKKIPILIIDDKKNGLDDKPVNIQGYPSKLRTIGWKIKYTIGDILNELCDK